MVVDMDRFLDHFGGLRQVSGCLQQELVLQDAVHPLCQGILVTIVPVRH